jgi:transforming growth factor-beta-induced protein
MKTQYRLFSILLLASLVLSACAAAAVEPEPMPTTAPTQAPLPTATPMPEPEVLDIVDTAVADGRFTTLAAALGAADLVDTLKGEGPFTVFAPTDEAFAQLPEGTVEALLEDIPQLTDILLYHVVPGKVMAADVVGLDGQEAATALEGKNIAISIVDGKVFLNESVEVIITDIEASNGVIHVIDSVLLPPADEAAAEMDIVDTAVADGRFTTLAAALGAADLVDTLKGEGPFTVFAPTDEAFAQLPEGTVEALLEDIPQLTDILLYHVVPGKVMAADVVGLDGQEAGTALEGKNIAISIVDGKVFLNESVEVIITDIEASNGVIHVIDSVLLPPADEAAAEMDIVDTAVADGRFTTLAAALGAADLVDTLKGEGPFTVFAPTDEAFAKLPEGTVEALLEDIPQLTDILLYHVVPGKVMAADVVGLDGQEAGTALEGKNIAISIVDGKVFLNESVEVIITDIETTNGVIHVIDAVLLPPQ